jgi:hypothetical protein
MYNKLKNLIVLTVLVYTRIFIIRKHNWMSTLKARALAPALDVVDQSVSFPAAAFPRE